MDRPGGVALASEQKATVSDVIRDFRRDQVIAAARALFAEQGTLDVSMGDIAERAGVSRSTLYNHFATRDDVLSACLASGQVQLVEAVGDAIEAAGDPVSKLAALIEMCVDHVDHNPVFFRLMAAREASEPSADAPAVELGLTSVAIGEAIRSIIDEGVASGDFEVDADEATWLVGIVIMGILQSRPAGSARAAAELASGVVTMLDRGFHSTTKN